MRLIPVTICRPGMKLAKPIYSEDGQILLGRHVELTDKLIRRLCECGISFVYIEDSLTSDLTIPELISDETRIKALSEVKASFKGMVDLPKRRNGVTYPYVGRQFKNIMAMVIDEISSQKDAMIMLMNMGTVDHYLYQHSLNVCIYSVLLGMAYGYTTDEVMTLGLGALLHDIGKTQISKQIMFKQSALTNEEFAEMKRHAEKGYYLLKDEPNIPLIVAHCAFQHHERLDGSGYPRGINGNEIHDYAKWIGLVDSYDAMTTSRVYRGPMLPHQAVEELYAGTGTLYEHSMVKLFRDKVAIYPIGLTVKLNTGESGVVVDINTSCPHRPIIRVLYNEVGELLSSPYETDLTKQLTTMIVGVTGEESMSLSNACGV
ncbi:HD-GYP domain-containing protein [Paenibacillus tarimensis]